MEPARIQSTSPNATFFSVSKTSSTLSLSPHHLRVEPNVHREKHGESPPSNMILEHAFFVVGMISRISAKRGVAVLSAGLSRCVAAAVTALASKRGRAGLVPRPAPRVRAAKAKFRHTHHSGCGGKWGPDASVPRVVALGGLPVCRGFGRCCFMPIGWPHRTALCRCCVSHTLHLQGEWLRIGAGRDRNAVLYIPPIVGRSTDIVRETYEILRGGVGTSLTYIVSWRWMSTC